MISLDYLAPDPTTRGGQATEPLLIVSLQKSKKSDEANPSHYLVVGDRSKPETWHLPTHSGGKPDHARMGAAWAALHGGYRGNKYGGPNKETAIAKLKSLYRREGLPIPGEAKNEDAKKAVLAKSAPTEAKVSHHLIVGDKDDPSTWQLPTHEDGEPHHGRMAAAHAALTGGYKGLDLSTHPQKEGALDKLQKLYKSEDLPWPGDYSHVHNDPAAESEEAKYSAKNEEAKYSARNEKARYTADTEDAAYSASNVDDDAFDILDAVNEGNEDPGDGGETQDGRGGRTDEPTARNGKFVKTADTEDATYSARNEAARKSGTINYDPADYAGNADAGHAASVNAPGKPNRKFYIRSDYAGNVAVGVEMGPSSESSDDRSFYERADYGIGPVGHTT